ncbi:MAG: PAS domain-containing protein [Sandaracinaceae bacterium]|nr:PAS domain-containing protein [Sandaracinaceae bacterium]
MDVFRSPVPSSEPPDGVLDHLLEGFQVIGRDYRYLYVNEAVARQGKSTRAHLLGRTMHECYPGIDATPMFAVLSGVMETRAAAAMENEFTFPDGTRGWFELRFEPVPEGVVILSVDITERKLTEERLRRSMRALATLSRCNRTLVHAGDESAFRRDLCELLVETGGYPLAGIFGSSGDGALALLERAGEPAVHLASERAAELARDASVSSREVIAHASSGEPGPRSLIALPVGACARHGVLVVAASEPEAFDGDEADLLTEVALDLAHGIETLRDRRRLERSMEELARLEARSRAIFDHLPIPAYVFRRDGERFVLDELNQAALDLVADPETALRGRGPEEVAEGVPHASDDLVHAALSRAVVRRELDCRLPGTTRTRRVALTYGRVPPDRVILHARDVTDQRRTEAQLAGAQRLDAIGRLAGGAAHDFNNLLSVILTYAELAAEPLPASSPIREDLEQIHAAAQRAATLTRGLLAFSRRQILEPRVVHLDEVIDGIVPMLRRLLREDIDVRVHPCRALGHVMADPGQIEQVIMNLAVNARDAMPLGGSLTIETANAELDEDYAARHVGVQPGRYVCVAVTDTGVGMDAATCERIFEPFFTTKEIGQGTGLGLAVVFGIVKQSGGNIWVYSEPGRGTTFKVYLPRVDEALEPASAQAPRPALRGGETILLVEDEPAVRRAAERILRAAGYRVLVAGGGAEALALASAEPGEIHLLLTDVVMPEMSGGELATRFGRARPSARVLYSSGYTDNAIVHHGVLDPGKEFLAKPFSAVELTRKVRAVLDGETGDGSSGARGGGEP